jgi:hypothetical protein
MEAGWFFSVHVSSVPDPHHVEANPDLAFVFDADADPIFHEKANPDPSPTFHCYADPDSDADSNLSFFIRIRITVKG